MQFNLDIQNAHRFLLVWAGEERRQDIEGSAGDSAARMGSAAGAINSVDLSLEHNTLVIMWPPTQEEWRHEVRCHNTAHIWTCSCSSTYGTRKFQKSLAGPLDSLLFCYVSARQAVCVTLLFATL